MTELPCFPRRRSSAKNSTGTNKRVASLRSVPEPRFPSSDISVETPITYPKPTRPALARMRKGQGTEAGVGACYGYACRRPVIGFKHRPPNCIRPATSTVNHPLPRSDQPEPEASRNDPQEQQEQQEPGQDNKRAEQMARELLESTSVGPSPPPTQARETSQTEERTDINHDPSLACMITPRPRDGSPPEEDDEEASTRPGEEPGEKPGEGTRGKGIMLRRESETEYLHESSREEGEDEASLGLPLGPSGDERWCGQPQGEPNPESTGRSIPEELHEQESRKPPVEEPEDDEARDPPRDVALEANEAHEETLDEHGTHADDQSLLK